MSHRQGFLFAVLALAILTAPALAGVDLHLAKRQLNTMVYEVDGPRDGSGVSVYGQDIEPAEVSASLECTARASTAVDALIVEDGLIVSGPMGIQIRREEVGDQQVCEASSVLELVFDVDEDCPYELEFMDVVEPRRGRFVFFRTDTYAYLCGGLIAEDSGFSGTLVAGGSYYLRIEFDEQMILIQHRDFNAALTVEFSVFNQSVATEAHSLSSIKALFR